MVRLDPEELPVTCIVGGIPFVETERGWERTTFRESRERFQKLLKEKAEKLKAEPITKKEYRNCPDLVPPRFKRRKKIKMGYGFPKPDISQLHLYPPLDPPSSSFKKIMLDPKTIKIPSQKENDGSGQ